MEREPLVFVGTSDLSGHFRGKSFPASDLPVRLRRGVGLAPTNIFMSAFGPIQVTTFGTRGEVLLIPDPTTRVSTWTIGSLRLMAANCRATTNFGSFQVAP